jgi:hypothetical protein
VLLEILKALGLDVPARINAFKANIDQRVEATTTQVSQAAQQAAVLAVLYAFAAVAALWAIVVVLIAVFLWVSYYYGVFAGLAVVFAILVVAAAILAMLAQGRSKSLAVTAAKAPRALCGATNSASGAGVVPPAPTVVPPAVAFVTPAAAAAPAGENPTARDLVAPLAALLSKTGSGGPVVAELLSGLSAAGAGPANSALDRAANVIRTGDRSNLFAVLAGAAVVGWLIARQSGRK